MSMKRPDLTEMGYEKEIVLTFARASTVWRPRKDQRYKSNENRRFTFSEPTTKGDSRQPTTDQNYKKRQGFDRFWQSNTDKTTIYVCIRRNSQHGLFFIS